MNLRDAFNKAITYQIKDLPKIAIVRDDRNTFYLKESEDYDGLTLTKDLADTRSCFYLTMEDLLSDSWEIKLNE